MRRDRALVIMAKAPRPGSVKTRLTPPLSSREAAALYACMLADTAEEMASLRNVSRYIFVAPAGALREFAAAPFGAFALRPQGAGDLGARMARAADEAFGAGARRVAIVGADCPALPASRVLEAFRELDAGAAVVLGPSADGGFHLAALARPAPRLFDGIAWGTETVLPAVAARCRRGGLPYALLRVERDVDTADDVAALARWARACGAPPCPRTRRWLSAPFHEYGQHRERRCAASGAPNQTNRTTAGQVRSACRRRARPKAYREYAEGGQRSRGGCSGARM